MVTHRLARSLAQKSTTVLRTRVSDLNRPRAQSRSLEELRQGIRDGISPGFMILAAEFVEEENDVVMVDYPLAALRGIQTPIPRMMSAIPTPYRRQSVHF